MYWFLKKSLFLVLLLFLFSCNRLETEKVVVEKWADGRPRVEEEYIINDKGERKLYKETSYFPGEKKHIEGTFDDEGKWNGVWISWHENGKKNSEGNFVNGKEHGKYTVWFPNGKVYYTGNYEHGEKVGKWKFYNESGKLIKETNYDLP